MSSRKRNSTVHDFSSLRLHPDGTRVSTTATSARHAQHTIQDRRGNWIAGDAGGLSRVKKRWTARVNESQTTDDEHTARADIQEDSPKDDKGKGKARATSLDGVAGIDDDSGKDPRALRRKLFAEDLSFLRTTPTSGVGADAHTAVDEIPTDGPSNSAVFPSSDLLKCIHYFASTYYSEMGQLRDCTREYRKEKKRKRLERLKAEEAAPRTSTSRESSLDVNRLQKTDHELNAFIGDHEKVSQRDGSQTAEITKQPSQSISTNTGVDMYKLFDGSALMAIGMLLQEHVDEQVSGEIPEGWEEAMLRAQGLDARGTNMKKRKGGRGRKRIRKLSEEEEALSTEYEDDTDIPMSMLSDDNGAFGGSLP